MVHYVFRYTAVRVVAVVEAVVLALVNEAVALTTEGLLLCL